MAEVERLQSELLDKVSEEAYPMTTSQLAAMAEELQVDESISSFFERIPERSFSSRDEVVEQARTDGEGAAESLSYEDSPRDL